MNVQVSKSRLQEVRKELGSLADQLKPLQMRYQAEKQRLDGMRDLQKKKEDLQVKLELAEQRRDLAMAADIKYILVCICVCLWCSSWSIHAAA